MRIISVSIPNYQTFKVGDVLNDILIYSIQISQVHIQGDSYKHFCGYSQTGEVLFEVNCLVPSIVTYGDNLNSDDD